MGGECRVAVDPAPSLLILPDPPLQKKYRHPNSIQFASDLHLEFFESW